MTIQATSALSASNIGARNQAAPTPQAPEAPRDVVTLGGPAPLDLKRPAIDPLETHWGNWPNENAFNSLITGAIKERWKDQQPPLPALLMKSLIAQESAFDPKAVSPTGFVGLCQVGRTEALAEGLKLEPVDERTVPEKNLHAGVGVLQGKTYNLQHPEDLAEKYPFAKTVVEAYKQYGQPAAGQLWKLSLGAYNGGEGTVMRAMARAFDRKIDPREWDNLIQPRNHPEESPLYGATLEVYGPGRALSKYKEMSKYPLQILARAPQGEGAQGPVEDGPIGPHDRGA